MLRFSGRRRLEGSKTAVITRFVLSLSTRIHVIVNGKMVTLKNGEIINLKRATLPFSNGMT